MSRKPRRETVVAWESDVAVPHAIRRDAQALGAVGAYERVGRYVVVLADGREVWLNERGEQTGRSPHGPAEVWGGDVERYFPIVAERTRAA
jgi:hypothetical protein